MFLPFFQQNLNDVFTRTVNASNYHLRQHYWLRILIMKDEVIQSRVNYSNVIYFLWYTFKGWKKPWIICTLFLTFWYVHIGNLFLFLTFCSHNTFIVCVFLLYACVYVHSSWRLHLFGTVGISRNRPRMLCWRRYYLCQVLSLLNYKHQAFLANHLILFTC